MFRFNAILLIGWGLTASFTHAKLPVPQVAERVDKLLAQELNASPGELAPRTSDDTYLRRVYLDLTGDIPTPEEITAFVLDPAVDKRDQVVRTLLAKPQYGQNWARYWRDVILYRRIEERALLVANPLVTKLTKDLNENRPWSEIATDFMTASGDVQSEGSTAIIMAQEGRTEETTAEMARIFLGIQIQCAQCHDHPWDSWKREQFHELAAFFPRLGVRPVLTPTRRSFLVYANDRPEGRRQMMMKPDDKPRGEPEHFMPDLEQPDERGARTQPKFFLTGATLPFGTPDSKRRGQLAQWFTENEWFATAVVNRLWGELVGEGFYTPVDDIGPDRTATAPETVSLLSNQFARSGHDLKWLLRVICATEAYQREARPKIAGSSFVANVAQPLRGDQLFNALLTALDFDEPTRGQYAGRGEMKAYGGPATPRLLFNATFGFDPSTDRENVSASIPQSLALMNTPQINQAITKAKTSLPSRLLIQFAEDDDAIVEELYLRCLSREPTDPERNAALDYLAFVESRKEAVEDLTWALVNSSEFAHRR